MKFFSLTVAALLFTHLLIADTPYNYPPDTIYYPDEVLYPANTSPNAVTPPDYYPKEMPYPANTSPNPSAPTECAQIESEPCTPGNCPLYPSAPARGTSCSLNFVTMSIPVLLVAGVATAILVTESHTSHSHN